MPTRVISTSLEYKNTQLLIDQLKKTAVDFLSTAAQSRLMVEESLALLRQAGHVEPVSPPDSRAVAAPTCSTCFSPGVARAVEVKGRLRTISYVCDACDRRWEIEDVDPSASRRPPSEYSKT